MKFDYSSQDSLINWVEKYDMACTDKAEFGVFGSLFFMGVVIGSLIVPRWSD